MDKALQMISQHAEDGAKLRRDFFAVHGGKVAEAARRMAVAVARGGKILLARRMPSTGPRSSSTGS